MNLLTTTFLAACCAIVFGCNSNTATTENTTAESAVESTATTPASATTQTEEPATTGTESQSEEAPAAESDCPEGATPTNNEEGTAQDGEIPGC